MKTEEIKFRVYDNNEIYAIATIINNRCKSVKLLTHVPRKYYYSFYNDMMTTFEEKYPELYKQLK